MSGKAAGRGVALRGIIGLGLATVGAGSACLLVPAGSMSSLDAAVWVWLAGLALFATALRIASVADVLVVVLGLPVWVVAATILASDASACSGGGDGAVSSDQLARQCAAGVNYWHASLLLLLLSLIAGALCPQLYRCGRSEPAQTR